MLAIERQRRILEKAKRVGSVRTQEIAAELDVTEETVRRDLDVLARQGLLQRTHGGAADVSILFDELSQTEREARQAEEKSIIAKLASEQIGENETIMLDASSTALEFAKQLPVGRGLRVVTYAHSILEKLALRGDIELILLGGVYEARGHRYRGLLTEISMRALRIDRFFFSGGGFHAQYGIGEPNPEEARFKAAAVAHASWNCALLDHTKISRISDHFFVKPSELDLLISNRANAKAFADLSTITP